MAEQPSNSRPGRTRVAITLVIVFSIVASFVIGYWVYKAAPEDSKDVVLVLTTAMVNAVVAVVTWLFVKDKL